MNFDRIVTPLARALVLNFLPKMRLIHVFVLAAAQSCDSGDTAVCLLQLRTASNGTETDLRAAGGTETDETETDAYYLSPSGNDATGERGKRNKPFRTLAGLAQQQDLANAYVLLRGGGASARVRPPFDACGQLRPASSSQSSLAEQG